MAALNSAVIFLIFTCCDKIGYRFLTLSIYLMGFQIQKTTIKDFFLPGVSQLGDTE